MHIERLTLKNFKSFGGTHELPFAPLFTAIVGPNGSGKSNILDGLRWVLGEGSANRLRITRQSDLIFQGSAGLSEASETDVELNLADGATRGQLRRHLDAGGSALFVNGVRTRIQDLVQFKQLWHLEGDESAFIGQGEVGAAVLQKPFQRRLQLEELFGIDLYRRKRDNALEEIRASRDELTRLRTLMSELQSRRDEIAPDLENARKAKEYRERLENLLMSLYHHRRFTEEARRNSLIARCEASEKNCAATERWANLWKNALAQLRQEGSEYSRARALLDEQLQDIEPRYNDVLRREAEIAAQKSENDFAARITSEEISRLESQLKESEATRGVLALEAGKLTGEASALSLQIQDLEDRLASRIEELERLKNRRATLLEREASLLETSQQMNARAETLELQGRERAGAIEILRAKKDSLVTQLTESDETLEKLEDNIEELGRRRAEAAAQSQETAIRLQSLRRSLAKAEAELENLITRTEAGLYPAPVRMILSAVKLGRLKLDTIPAVESFSCGADLAPAIEAYLGGRQFWLLVDTMADARVGIDLLKERTGGRATFLPLERCRARNVAKTPAGAGILGWAFDLVTSQPRWQAAVQYLLGDLLVVKDYATGARLASGARYPIVTLEGEVFSPSGTVSGGKNARAIGALQLRNQKEELEAQISADRSAQEKFTKRMAAAEKTEAKISEEIERVNAAAAIQKAKTESLRRANRETSDELSAMLSEEKSAADRIAEYRASAEKSVADAAKIREEINAIVMDESGSEETERLNALRTQGLLVNERLNAKRAELEKSVRAVSDIRRQLMTSREESRKISAKSSELLASGEKISREKAERAAEKKSVSDRRAELDRKNVRAARRMEGTLLRQTRAQSAYESAIRDRVSVKTEQEKSRERLENLIVESDEKYPYPEDFRPTDSAERISASCRYTERALKDLGEVNMGALSEDASLCERLEYLGDQVKDVQRGIDDLQTLISSTDKQAGTLFAGALSKIDRRFDELFQRLFGGGEAHLKAQENVPLWDAGVEIIARPPGKKGLYLAQLSGGEQTLTALSLLFASMEVAQVPLVVLDEVDAALDDANLTRFAEMVVEYSKSIQVIAMTHRRTTMEHAEVMYGVTMREPGLSQIVSVKVDQWN